MRSASALAPSSHSHFDWGHLQAEIMDRMMDKKFPAVPFCTGPNLGGTGGIKCSLFSIHGFGVTGQVSQLLTTPRHLRSGSSSSMETFRFVTGARTRPKWIGPTLKIASTDTRNAEPSPVEIGTLKS